MATVKKSAVTFLDVIVSALIVTLSETGCGSLDLASHWRTKSVTVDGRNTEWTSILTPAGSTGTSIGIQNDGEFLYIGLISTNHSLQQQIMRQGITFWFDRDGGSEKRFGIHYPVRFGGRGAGTNESGNEGQEYAPRPRFQGADAELDILGPGSDDHSRMTKAQTGGIEVVYNIINDTLVYEMKVPLEDNGHHPFAIGTKPGSKLGAGLETSPRGASRPAEYGDSDRPPEGGTGDGMGGSMGGGRGGRGGRRGGEGYGGRGSREAGGGEPLSIWAHVQLAVQDTTSNEVRQSP